MTPLGSLNLLFLALFAIGLAQLIRYLFDFDYKPSLILRHGSKLLSLYVVFTLFLAVRHIIVLTQYLSVPDIERQFIFLFNSIMYIFYFVAKSIVLVGIAQFLKRLTPVLDEHRSLI